jgi:hypothetical protein
MRIFRRPRHRPVDEDSLCEVDRSGKTCQRHGHIVKNPGTDLGWCPRCEHSVSSISGNVLYYGKFYRKVPPHDVEAKERTAEWARDYVARCSSPTADRAALDRERRQAFGIMEGGS